MGRGLVEIRGGTGGGREGRGDIKTSVGIKFKIESGFLQRGFLGSSHTRGFAVEVVLG